MGRISEGLYDLTESLAEVYGEGELDQYRGVLGGDYAYGAEFANDIFEMHPYHWGDCVCGKEAREDDWLDGPEHEATCYQSVISERGFLDFGDERGDHLTFAERDEHNHAITDAVCAEMGLDPVEGVYVHCTCPFDEEWGAWRRSPEGQHAPTCGIVRPNFRHHGTGLEVRWYKYIGRGMKVSREATRDEWRRIMRECRDSVAAGERMEG